MTAQSPTTAASVAQLTEAKDLIRAVAVLLAAVFMVGSNAVFAARQVPISSEGPGGPIDPAAYAFAIWGVIFLLATGFGVYAVLPTNPSRALVRQTGWFAAMAFITAGLWPIAVAYRKLDLAEVVIVAMWGFLAAAYLYFIPIQGMTSAERWLGGLLFGMFFGWVTAANAVSLQSRTTDWGASLSVMK
ncbi:MAG: hypothetical protein ACR2J8_15310, partial [Thermomicrobiales bacterium]